MKFGCTQLANHTDTISTGKSAYGSAVTVHWEICLASSAVTIPWGEMRPEAATIAAVICLVDVVFVVDVRCVCVCVCVFGPYICADVVAHAYKCSVSCIGCC